MNAVDRSTRLLLAGVAAILILTDQVFGMTILLLMLGGIAFLTSGLTGFWSAGTTFNLSTARHR